MTSRRQRRRWPRTLTASSGNRQNRANGDDAEFDGKLSRKAQKRKAVLLRGSREPRDLPCKHSFVVAVLLCEIEQPVYFRMIELIISIEQNLK